MSYYVVARGHRIGIFPTWEKCRLQVNNFPDPVFRRFTRFNDAQAYLHQHNNSSHSTKCIISDTLFTRNSEGRISIYTDGSCIGNGTANARAGIGVFFEENHPFNVSRFAPTRKTNNGAELEAIIEALRIIKAHDLKDVTILTDSQFVINSLKIWWPLWRDRGWRTSSGQPVVYKDELFYLGTELRTLNIYLEFVPGHHGVYGNEKADQLAKSALNQHA